MADDAREQLTTEEFARWWKETGEHELRQILLWRWDPIGVADYFPNTADEYDGYAPQIVQSLRNGAPPEDLARQLCRIERDLMGLGGVATDRVSGVSFLLVEWFENSQASWRDFGPVRR